MSKKNRILEDMINAAFRDQGVMEAFQAPSNKDASGWKKMFSGVFKEAMAGKQLQYLVVNVKTQLPDLSYQEYQVSGSVLRLANFLSDSIASGSMMTVEVVLATNDRNLARKHAREV